jgi:hypothetical protein
MSSVDTFLKCSLRKGGSAGATVVSRPVERGGATEQASSTDVLMGFRRR